MAQIIDSNRFAMRREIADTFPPGCTVLKAEESLNPLTMGRVVGIRGEIDSQPFVFSCDEMGKMALTVGSIVFDGKAAPFDSPVKACGDRLHQWKAAQTVSPMLVAPTMTGTRTDIVKDILLKLVADMRTAADAIEATLDRV